MDKYHISYLNTIFGNKQSLDKVVWFTLESIKNGVDVDYTVSDEITFIQDNDDLDSKTYKLIFNKYLLRYIAKVEVNVNNTWKEVSKEKIIIDFDNRYSKFKFTFISEVIDPLEVDLFYQEANAILHDKRVENLNNEEYKKYVNSFIKYASGISVINIYTKEIKNGSVDIYVKFSNDSYLVKHIELKDETFITITDLAFGEYYFNYCAFDLKGKQITYKSDLIKVGIEVPTIKDEVEKAIMNIRSRGIVHR